MAARFPDSSPTQSLTSESSGSDDTCLICTELFTNPKILPCSHTFCEECLSTYMKTLQRDGTIEQGTIPCPVCRQMTSVRECCKHSSPSLSPPSRPQTPTSRPQTPTSRPQTPAINLKLNNKRLYCDVCKYKTQDVYAKDHCASCGINYCGHCSYEHGKHCLFQAHAVVPVSEMDRSSIRCELHESEVVKYYCTTCMQPLCTICAVSQHKTHETLELREALGNKREMVASKIGGMSARVMEHEEFLAQLEDVQSLKGASIKKTKMEIERHVTNLIGQLQSHKHEMMEELDTLHEGSMKQLALEKDNVTFSLANLKSLWKFAAKLTEPSQTMQMLAMYDSVMAMIHSAENAPPPSLPQDCIMINMLMPCPDLSIGRFQKCELSTDILATAPTVCDPMINGYNASASFRSGAMSPVIAGPPDFYSNKIKPQVKWLSQPRQQWKIDKVGGRSGEICETYDVCFLPDGAVVVAEWMNQRLQIFDEGGVSRDLICANQLQPWGVSVNREGDLVVTDDRERSVKIISPTGQCLKSWRRQAFGWPRGIVENSLGQYVVSDTEHGRHTVSIHLPDGRCVKKFGSQGSGNAQFHWPRYLTVDHDDRIIVSDGSNHCVKVFDPSGGFLFKFGGIGHGDGQMKHPRGVCVDPLNNIIVADQDNNRVSLYSIDGKFMRQLLSLSKPWGVSMSIEGLLAVTQKPSIAVYKVFDSTKLVDKLSF